jgi:hypothetical protein
MVHRSALLNIATAGGERLLGESILFMMTRFPSVPMEPRLASYGRPNALITNTKNI